MKPINLATSASTIVGVILFVGAEPAGAVAPLQDTAPPVLGAPPAHLVQTTSAQPDDWAMYVSAANLLDQMLASGALPQVRAEQAREALDLLVLWEAPAPTELSDGSDGDFTLIWRRPGLAASLTYTSDEVVGYAYGPHMIAPWMFEHDGIGIPELNTLRRALG